MSHPHFFPYVIHLIQKIPGALLRARRLPSLALTTSSHSGTLHSKTTKRRTRRSRGTTRSRRTPPPILPLPTPPANPPYTPYARPPPCPPTLPPPYPLAPLPFPPPPSGRAAAALLYTPGTARHQGDTLAPAAAGSHLEYRRRLVPHLQARKSRRRTRAVAGRCGAGSLTFSTSLYVVHV